MEHNSALDNTVGRSSGDGSRLGGSSAPEEMAMGTENAGGGGDDDGVEERERGGGEGGNRWPRDETLALLRIRSDMNLAFRDSTLKAPLWSEVSR